MANSKNSRPVILIIRDGWGCNPFPERNASNAVFLARKPVDDRLMREFPHVLIKTCGNDVGLPDGVGILFGMSFGYADDAAPANKSRTDRVSVDTMVRFF